MKSGHEGSLFEREMRNVVHEPETVRAMVAALAQLLLEAARPAESACERERADDESQDHG